MTLLSLITEIKEVFPEQDEVEICAAVNELENTIRCEIFSPSGIECRKQLLDVKEDITERLLLDEEYKSLYTDYLKAVFSLRNSDSDETNIYTELFNTKFKALQVQFRRKYLPKKVTYLKGGNI